MTTSYQYNIYSPNGSRIIDEAKGNSGSRIKAWLKW
jgi:hypothetical protein